MTICVLCVYIYQNGDNDVADNTTDGWWIMPLVIGVGGIAGIVMAERVEMTGMPQMVGLLNSFGGLAAAFESIALYFYKDADTGFTKGESRIQMAFLLIGLVIGMVTFVGSIMACLKLDGTIQNPVIPAKKLLILLTVGGTLALTVLSGMTSYAGTEDEPTAVLEPIFDGPGTIFISLLTVISCIWGVMFVIPIGGADMPVVISVLNSFSGVSGCAAGFMLENDLLIITGALVASSGAILSYIMCKAMNRSLMNVLSGGFGEAAAPTVKKDAGPVAQPDHYPIDTDGVAQALLGAKTVLITPGYGMAVSRAQYSVSEITKLLRARNIKVIFGIHPVAGRLPGHMNVLLAEARVPYDIVQEMDEVNPDMGNVDVVMVIGANDTVNPAAEDDPDSSIAGMPVIRVWLAKTVIVMKRSMAQGYAAVDNPLFFKTNTRMYFGDAKKNCDSLLEKIRAAGDVGGGASASTAKAAAAKAEDPSSWPAVVKTVGIPAETAELERRVAMSPDIALKLRKQGFGIFIERGAGLGSSFTDEAFAKAGATIVDSAADVYNRAEIILKVEKPTMAEVALLRPQNILISYAAPAFSADLLKAVAGRGATFLAMDNVPRITIAQKLDSLSTMGKISGYRAVVEAASHFERFFVGEITAAGKYPPARVLIIGAGVAGLAAIGVAKSMGAEVRCFDTRLVTKEQVESLGAEFLLLQFNEDGAGAGGYAKVMSEEFYQAEMRLFAEQAPEVDIIITTAQIPGRKAPILLKKEHVEAMKPGSVLVDIAAMSGGNCELTRPGELYVHNGVKIIGFTDLTSRMATQASSMYATNMFHLLNHMGGAAKFTVDTTNEVVRPMMCTNQGNVTYPPPAAAGPPPEAPKPAASSKSHAPVQEYEVSMTEKVSMGAFTIISLVLIAVFFPKSFTSHLMVFMLSCVVGYNSIWNVSPSLHTPLMSVSNAISGVVLLGGMLQILGELSSVTLLLSAVAVAVAAINVGGGFWVTARMLKMFIVEKEKEPATVTKGGYTAIN
eukprot:TRINITY_DN423_c0_g1_i1.p1 TRINITY_DN423_c0_g1~~TRINITY_DN423_c0_g1_i1.p1  ORF type:complete len:1070 (-),score=291.30 TRINITY_DN423_c0_g1_i1:106-3141(-)